jgi:hypothetical protein
MFWLLWILYRSTSICSLGGDKPSLLRSMLGSAPSVHLDIVQVYSMYQGWHDLVKAYSKTDLTYPTKDKLAAIAAIARNFGRLLPDLYVASLFLSPSPLKPQGSRFAGLSQSTPPLQLAWHTFPLTIERMYEDFSHESIYIDTGPYSFVQIPSW